MRRNQTDFTVLLAMSEWWKSLGRECQAAWEIPRLKWSMIWHSWSILFEFKHLYHNLVIVNRLPAHASPTSHFVCFVCFERFSVTLRFPRPCIVDRGIPIAIRPRNSQAWSTDFNRKDRHAKQKDKRTENTTLIAANTTGTKTIVVAVANTIGTIGTKCMLQIFSRQKIIKVTIYESTCKDVTLMQHSVPFCAPVLFCNILTLKSTDSSSPVDRMLSARVLSSCASLSHLFDRFLRVQLTST